MRACPRCGRQPAECTDERASGPALFRIRLEKRRGKPVTVAAGEGVGAEDLKRLLKELKVRLATGGTGQGGALELQGDHRDAVRSALADRGYRVKGGGR